jgi:hypothetical protein
MKIENIEKVWEAPDLTPHPHADGTSAPQGHRNPWFLMGLDSQKLDAELQTRAQEAVVREMTWIGVASLTQSPASLCQHGVLSLRF